MANFKYKALSRNGSEVEGVIHASDKDNAVIQLRSSELRVLSIRKVDEITINLNDIVLGRLKEKDLSLLCKQFSIVLTAGLPLAKSVELVGQQTEDKRLKKLLFEVSDDVKSGRTMADSFENRGKYLPTVFIETIRAGEEGGNISNSFGRLSTYFAKKASVSDKVISALVYPAFVVAIAIVVVGVIMVKVVPVFSSSFSDLGIELPLATRIVIGSSNLVTNWGWVFVLLFVALYVLYTMIRRSDDGLYRTERFKLNVPLLGKIRMMSQASEFANAFATMLSSGVPAVRALNVASRSVSNKSVSVDLEKSCSLVESGYKIADALKQETTLPNMLLEVTGIGEESGSLEKTLATISEYYDNEVEVASSRALAILEPAIIVFLAIIVIIIMLAVYTPMLSVYSTIS